MNPAPTCKTATNRWMERSFAVASHVFAMLGFVFIGLGLFGFQAALDQTISGRIATRGMVVTWLGVGLALPYYAAETLGLNVIAQRSLDTGDPTLLDLVGLFRLGTVPLTMFAVGLVLLGLGSVLIAGAILRSGVLPRRSGVLFAVGSVLLIPQFLAPQFVRMVHGAGVAVGCLWMAWALHTADPLSAGSSGESPASGGR